MRTRIMAVDDESAVSPGLWVDPACLLASLARMIETDDTPPRERAAAATVARSVGLLGQWGSAPASPIGAEVECRAFDRRERILSQDEGSDSPALVRLAPPETQALEQALRVVMPGGGEGHVEGLVTIEGGYSKQTSLFDWVTADGQHVPCAMRRDVELQHVGTSVTDEYDVVVALFDAGLAVPRPIALIRGCAGIAQNFMITERMPGRAIGGPLGNGGAKEVDPVPALAGFFASLHSIDPATLGLDRFAVPFDLATLEAQIVYWTDRYHAHRQVPSPLVDGALQWLWDNRAAGVQPGAVVHGDGGIYNMLFDGDRFVAMLDWELVHVGSPVWDLAYVRDGVAEFGSFETFIDLYVGAGGRRPDPMALAFYNVFRTVRSAIMCTVGAALFNRGEPVSFDLLNVNLMLYPRLVGALPAAIAEAQATR